MAHKNLFASFKKLFRPAETRNEAGGPAYALTPKHALAQLAATGCLGGVFYATPSDQLNQLRALLNQVEDNTYLAKLALYARQRAGMKDMPAAVLVALSKRDPQLMHKVFDRVVDNGRVLRTVFQMIRSGQLERKSLSSSLQRAFQRWLNEASVGKLLSASIGNDPSLRDVLRMARPTPKDNARRALFGWLTNKDPAKWAPASVDDLPDSVRKLTAFRLAPSDEEQASLVEQLDVRWDLLSGDAKSPRVWKAIARKMGPQALRMNLNTLLRHRVLKDQEMVDYVAQRLADPEEIRTSRQFPYQFLAAYLNASAEVPRKIVSALQQAAELACGNVPVLPGPMVIGLDVSGSMASPVTGTRGRGATTKMRCVDVAALFAAAILRRNPECVVIPFDTQAYIARWDANDSILSLANRLAAYGGGGTDCSIPLKYANAHFRNRPFAGCVLVSDNQSWVYGDQAFAFGAQGTTGVVAEWSQFAKRQQQLGVPSPKLVCIDIQAYVTTQAPEVTNVLNVGGFNDAVFEVLNAFLRDDAARFVAEIEAMEL